MTPGAHAPHADDLVREQLSSMMDGALPTDESRFLLRRMEHDDALADTWQRWQLYGDAMRGHAGRLLPPDFAARVGRAIADDAALADAPQPAVRSRALRWGGGAAVAASIALAALLGTRALAPAPALDANPGAQALPLAAGAQAPATSVPVQPPIVTSEAGVALALATEAGDGATKPRIMAADAATPATTRREAAPVVAAADRQGAAGANPPGDAAAPELAARPWPRSLLGDGHGGSMSAGFGMAPFAVDPALRMPERPVPRFGVPMRAESAADTSAAGPNASDGAQDVPAPSPLPAGEAVAPASGAP